MDVGRTARSAVTGVGRRFLLLWVASISVAIIAAAGVEYLIGAQRVYRVTLDDATDTYLLHAQQIAAQVEGIEDPYRRLVTTYTELGRVESASPGLVYLAAYDDAARVLAQRGRVTDAPPSSDLIREVLRTGEPLVDRHRATWDGAQHYAFLLLVEADDGPMVLFVEQEASVVDALVLELAWAKLAGLGVMLAVALPLSYVLGGRALRRRQQWAEREATTDPLTGLGGRRAFEPVLDSQARHTARAATALAVLDVDAFKQVNDTYGHARGDEVLCALATAADALRAGDSLYRLGGDEFAVVLPGADGEAATTVLERLRVRFTDLTDGVSLSIGVAAVERGASVDARRMWSRADAALYEAKRRGRGCTVVWSPDCCDTPEPAAPGRAVAVARRA